LRVLVIKTSSLGDVIHALPALTDAARAIPGIRFDWVVEEGFAEIPTWHPAVDKVIPVAISPLAQEPLADLQEWRVAPLQEADPVD
jgi:ADP-heptose:LPS heptosyltransferase